MPSSSDSESESSMSSSNSSASDSESSPSMAVTSSTVSETLFSLFVRYFFYLWNLIASKLSPNKKPGPGYNSKCLFDPSTSQRQNFSIPDKIVYYLAKNATNPATFQKLITTCKYFFTVNPVFVVPEIMCWKGTWRVRFDGMSGKWKDLIGFKFDQPINFKIWITEYFCCVSADASKMVPWIYKIDAMDVILEGKPIKFDDFLLFVGNATQLLMTKQLVQYENGKSVPFEDIVANLSKLEIFCYTPCSDARDINFDTVRKLMETEHFPRLSNLSLSDVSESLDVEEMFLLILENKHIKVRLCYHDGIPDAYKELVKNYSILAEKEKGCNSTIFFSGTGFLLPISSSEDDSSDSFNDDENENDEDEE